MSAQMAAAIRGPQQTLTRSVNLKSTEAVASQSPRTVETTVPAGAKITPIYRPEPSTSSGQVLTHFEVEGPNHKAGEAPVIVRPEVGQLILDGGVSPVREATNAALLQAQREVPFEHAGELTALS